jgi:biotin carboxylase
MTRVVVILPSSTYRAGEFVKASAELGVELIVASEGEAPIEMGDRYLQIDCSDVDAAAARIVALGDTSQIDGIVAADDTGVVVAAVAGQKLGLPSNDPDAARATRDKAVMRRRLELGEVPQPRWATVDPSDNADTVAESIGFPLVIKPLALSAGQGVIRVERPEDLTESAGDNPLDRAGERDAACRKLHGRKRGRRRRFGGKREPIGSGDIRQAGRIGRQRV